MSNGLRFRSRCSRKHGIYSLVTYPYVLSTCPWRGIGFGFRSCCSRRACDAAKLRWSTVFHTLGPLYAQPARRTASAQRIRYYKGTLQTVGMAHSPPHELVVISSASITVRPTHSLLGSPTRICIQLDSSGEICVRIRAREPKLAGLRRFAPCAQWATTGDFGATRGSK
jgi:hypothetical protein